MGGLLPPKRPQKRRRVRQVQTLVDPTEPPAPPAPPAFGEDRRDQVERELAADVTLYGKPSLRSFRLYMQTDVVRDLGGRPVTDDDGRRSSLTLAETLWQVGTANACNPNHPKQYEHWLALMTFLHGQMPKNPDVLPPPPVPPASATGEADAAPSGEVPPDVAAKRFMQMMEMMQKIAAEESDRNRKDTAIDVKAELVAEAAALGRKDG